MPTASTDVLITSREARRANSRSVSLIRNLLYPVEWLVLSFGILTVLLYHYHKLGLRSPLELYWGRISGGIVMYGWGLLLCFFIVRLSGIQRGWREKRPVAWRETWSSFRVQFLKPISMLRDFRVYNAIALMFVVFINLKNLIPFVTGRIYGGADVIDDTLFRWEQVWGGGKIFSEHLIVFFGVEAAPLLSAGYTLFYPFTAILIFAFVLQRSSSLRHEFMLVFAWTWFLGILVVYLFPSWGPVFFRPELFDALPETKCSELQQQLWHMKTVMEGQPRHPGGVYMISGLPSLHVAVVFLGCLYLKKISTYLAYLCWIFLFVTVLTTMYFGWHYFLDDLAAIALVYAAIFIGRRNARWFGV